MWELINRSKHKACISSILQLNGNSIEFSLSTWTRSRSKASLSKVLTWDDLTTLLVQVDKNSMEFSFNSVHYLYIYYMVYVLLFPCSSCDSIMWHHLTLWCITYDMSCDTFSHSLCSKFRKEKKNKIMT